MALASRNEILEQEHPTNLEFNSPRKDPLTCSRLNFHISPAQDIPKRGLDLRIGFGSAHNPSLLSLASASSLNM